MNPPPPLPLPNMSLPGFNSKHSGFTFWKWDPLASVTDPNAADHWYALPWELKNKPVVFLHGEPVDAVYKSVTFAENK